MDLLEHSDHKYLKNARYKPFVVTKFPFNNVQTLTLKKSLKPRY